MGGHGRDPSSHRETVMLPRPPEMRNRQTEHAIARPRPFAHCSALSKADVRVPARDNEEARYILIALFAECVPRERVDAEVSSGQRLAQVSLAVCITAMDLECIVVSRVWVERFERE